MNRLANRSPVARKSAVQRRLETLFVQSSTSSEPFRIKLSRYLDLLMRNSILRAVLGWVRVRIVRFVPGRDSGSFCRIEGRKGFDS